MENILFYTYSMYTLFRCVQPGSRGAALIELGRYAEVVASYDKAISINPADPMVKSSWENTLNSGSVSHTPIRKTS